MGLRGDDRHLRRPRRATAISAICACDSTSTDPHVRVGLRRDLPQRRRQLPGSTCTRRRTSRSSAPIPTTTTRSRPSSSRAMSTGLYDVLIELYDADTGELVDEFGPNESPEFSTAPARGRRARRRGRRRSADDDHDGGGGAVSWLGLAGLLGALALRRRRRRRPKARQSAAAGTARRRCSILATPFPRQGARVSLKTLGLAVAAFARRISSTASFAQPRTPPREITQVKGDLYRARNGNWYTVFLVTPAGIILGDPINETFAPWLKGELDTRFPGKPVRYVVYSHSHFDHAAGGAVFADTATFVGAREHAAQHGRPLPADAGRHDRPQRQRRHRSRRDRHPDEHAPRRLRHGPRLLRRHRPQQRRRRRRRKSCSSSS